MQTKLFYLFIRKCLQVLRIAMLHLSNGLHCLFIFSLPELHFFHSGVQLLGKCSTKGYLLLELEVPFILYMLDMDVSRPACSLREMSILCSIQELTMARTERADNEHTMLDVQHHKSQRGKNVLMQWLHGSFPPHKLL
jgi:hypothetical protein